MATKAELEKEVEALKVQLQELKDYSGGLEAGVGGGPYTEKLEALLDDCEAKIPDFFYGKGWRAHV